VPLVLPESVSCRRRSIDKNFRPKLTTLPPFRERLLPASMNKPAYRLVHDALRRKIGGEFQKQALPGGYDGGAARAWWQRTGQVHGWSRTSSSVGELLFATRMRLNAF
jgi:hypothetical protein